VVRLRDLGEREGLRDREREAPGLDQLADLGERVDRAHRNADLAGPRMRIGEIHDLEDLGATELAETYGQSLSAREWATATPAVATTVTPARPNATMYERDPTRFSLHESG
jgi:hypothetical protein